jgi:hypothetical protein
VGLVGKSLLPRHACSQSLAKIVMTVLTSTTLSIIYLLEQNRAHSSQGCLFLQFIVIHLNISPLYHLLTSIIYLCNWSFYRNTDSCITSYISISTIACYCLLWQVRAVNDEIRFELVPDEAKNVTHLTTVKFNYRTSWHVVSSLAVHFGLLIFFGVLYLELLVIAFQLLRWYEVW